MACSCIWILSWFVSQAMTLGVVAASLATETGTAWQVALANFQWSDPRELLSHKNVRLMPIASLRSCKKNSCPLDPFRTNLSCLCTIAGLLHNSGFIRVHTPICLMAVDGMKIFCAGCRSLAVQPPAQIRSNRISKTDARQECPILATDVQLSSAEGWCDFSYGENPRVG